MAIYEMTQTAVVPLTETSFPVEQLTERGDLQRLLRDSIEVLVPGAMVLAEEFGSWDDSKRRIDLLLLDGDANLQVVELKRSGCTSTLVPRAVASARPRGFSEGARTPVG